MKWNKYTLKTTIEAVDIISAMLYDLGICGIEIEDNVPVSEEDSQKMFVDIALEPKNDDITAFIHFYLNSGINKDEEISLLNMIKEGMKEASELVNIGEGSISAVVTDEDEWMDNWKQFFKPFRIGGHILIKPVWEECTDITQNDIVIEINPGRAFGTGSHETTKLCILAMMKYIKEGSIMLDVGTGSGILSVAGIKLGAKKAVGTDIDITAIEASKENSMLNGYHENKALFLNLNIIKNEEDRRRIHIESPEGYDLIAANMLADAIILLSDIVKQFMKRGAYFISSGILDEKADTVKEALLRNGFKIVDVLTLGEWVSFVAILE